MNDFQTTVVVPVYNEEDAVRISLDRIRDLKLHEKFEFIYIDDGSEDSNYEIIREYPVKAIRPGETISFHRLRIRVLRHWSSSGG